MKILEISTSYHPESFIWTHLEALQEVEGHEVLLMHPQKKTQEIREDALNSLTKGNLPLVVLGLGKLFKKVPDIYVDYFNLATIKRFKPDLIHCHFGWSAVTYYPLLEKLNIPFTVSLRGTDLFIRPLFDRTYKAQLTRVLQKASGIHVVSESVKTELEENYIYNCPVNLIYTPANCNTWKVNEDHNTISEGSIIVAIGRLHWIKDFGELIQQFALVRKTIPDLKLRIIGNGPEKEKLLFLIKKLGLGDSVELLGKQPQQVVAKVMHQASLFVLTSWSEGLPNVLIEAVLAGKLAVVPDHLQLQKVFSEDEVLFYDKFSDSALSTMLQTAIAMDPEKMRVMTGRAKAKALKVFDSKNHAANFFEFFRSSIGYR
ncbi:glycosyltransferase family 4 protein [Mangrovimonas sp. TPBH4]|uniref:glycosyltransferase family 4 protein n=1 Tax=Mangrovimonas sp. TPBH4 TaxID=1645914 RepID=UPI0006B58CE8|nr:glycosyltransferase family 4 protein [Mangrovimonas sp. TPBH4]